jgi:glycosyltransferase involved in cell wall biosynthesis
MPETVLVVPCFNEARRLAVEQFEGFVKVHPDLRFLLVNDGSTDNTLALLRGLEERDAAHFSVLDQQPNQGKAEAVRRGMLVALETDARYAGFWDADLATPLEAAPEFVDLLESRPRLEMVFGSRVKLLGRSIERSALRHYLGRIFATAASLTLGLAIYDTQCGAKLFRVSPETAALFQEPFVTRWIFDIEIIARLIRARRGTEQPQPEDVIYELPLRAWHDIAGSKVKAGDFPKAIFETLRIRRKYLSRRALKQRGTS